MNSNQRSEVNNQSSNGGNEKSVSSSRGGTVEKDNLNPEMPRSGTLNGEGQVNRQSSDSSDRDGSQTGSRQQAEPPVHESNDAAGGYPRSPGGANQLDADEKMDDDTGFSRGNRQAAEIDEGSRQERQSNVGRRSDMTPD